MESLSLEVYKEILDVVLSLVDKMVLDLIIQRFSPA